MILHIPHSSTENPKGISFPEDEITKMTDWYTDELFDYPCDKIVFPYTRLYCDVERFTTDEMDRAGMGICYTHRSDGSFLRSVSIQEKDFILKNYYFPHHEKLMKMTDSELDKYGISLIVDCHSFPEKPLPYESDSLRPDICIGVYKNTPNRIKDFAVEYFESKGYKVAVNRPFSGSIVPIKHIGNPKVVSIMIEMNRSLYLNGRDKTDNFPRVKENLNAFLGKIENEVFG